MSPDDKWSVHTPFGNGQQQAVWDTSPFFIPQGSSWTLNAADRTLIQSHMADDGGVVFNFRLVSDTGNQTWEVRLGNLQLHVRYRLPNVPPGNPVHLTASPAAVASGATTTLVSNGFSDSDGKVTKVRFYRSTHTDGALHADDVPLGDATPTNGQCQWSGSTAGWPLGANYVFAQSQDDDGAWSDPAWATGATVTVSNVPPQIGSFSANPNTANLGDSITLSASSVTDADADGIQRVRFYRSTHADGQLHWNDVVLGDATVPSGGTYSWTGSTAGWLSGYNYVFAQAEDNNNAWSDPANSYRITLGTPANAAPTIGALGASPTSLNIGSSVTLTVGGVTDSDGTIQYVRFYHSTRSDGSLYYDDTVLGDVSSSSGGGIYDWSGSTAGWQHGTNYVFAQACDNSGAFSDLVRATVDVGDAAPTVANLGASPDSLTLGDATSLTASSVADSDGTIQLVRFYRSTHSDGALHWDDIVLGDVTSPTGGDWVWTGSTTGWMEGTNYVFAQAEDDDYSWSTTASATVTAAALPNVSPTIGTFAPSPASLSLGDSVTLTAGSVADSDGTIQLVRFYRSLQTDGVLHWDDVILGDVAAPTGGDWVWAGSTAGWLDGTNYVFVQAEDDDGAWSNVAQATVTANAVSNALPTIGTFGASPGSLTLGDTATLTASSVADSDGTVQLVRFFLSTHSDGTLHQDDLILGDATSPSGGDWVWSGSTTGWGQGTNYVFAMAEDNSGSWSDAAQGSVVAAAMPNDPPTIGTFGAAPGSLTLGATATLTAGSVADSDGTIQLVRFYRSTHTDGTLHLDDVVLGDVDSPSGGDWVWSGSTAGWRQGTNYVFAKAEDNDGSWSDAAGASLVASSSNVAPTIGGLSASSNPIRQGRTLTLTANNVVDTDGSLWGCNFWVDDVGPNEYLGEDTNGLDGWSWSGNAANWSLGQHTFFVQAVDNQSAGSNYASVTVTVIDAGLSVNIGVGGAKRVIYTDTGGATVTLSLTGGSGALTFDGSGLGQTQVKTDVHVTGTNVVLSEIALSGTDARSSLGLSTKLPKGGAPAPRVSLISGDDPLKSLSAPGVDLAGTGIAFTGAGYIASVVLHDIVDGADVALPGNGAVKGVAFTAHSLGLGTVVQLGSAGGKMKVAQWLGGSLQAPTVASLTVSGDSKTGIRGDLGADIVLTGHDAKGVSLGSLKVVGVAGPGTVRAPGSIGAVQLGAATSLDVLAAINTATAGDPTITRRADNTGDFSNTLASIKSITIAPPRGLTGRFLTNSNFSAANIGAVTIVNPNWNNDQAGLDDTQDNFGFWSLATKSVKCKDTSDPKNKAKNGTWKPGALPPAVLATLDDLNIQAVV